MFNCTVAVSLKWLLHCNDSSCLYASIAGLSLWLLVDADGDPILMLIKRIYEISCRLWLSGVSAWEFTWCAGVLGMIGLVRPLICFLWCFSVGPRLHCTTWLCKFIWLSLLMDIDEPRTPRILAPPLPNTGSGGSSIAAGSGGAQATFLRRRTIGVFLFVAWSSPIVREPFGEMSFSIALVWRI